MLKNFTKPVSKSTYLSLLQCPKLFWTIFNELSQIPGQKSAQALSRFNEGKLVEKYSRQLFPKGISIDHSISFAQTIAQSKSALNTAPFNTIITPIYNALITAPSEKLICEIDILIPVKNGSFDLYEVKSSTSIKDHYPPDIAFQKHVCQKAGLKIRKTHLITINSDYVRQGEIEPKKLLWTFALFQPLFYEHPTVCLP